jgi:hypothetical protein
MEIFSRIVAYLMFVLFLSVVLVGFSQALKWLDPTAFMWRPRTVFVGNLIVFSAAVIVGRISAWRKGQPFWG